MPYKDTKIYFDGSHYIAIPPENFPSEQRKRKKHKPPNPKQNGTLPTTTPKDKFETAYAESQALPKRERKKYIKEKLQGEFQTAEQLKEFVAQNMERKKINAIKREIRLWRKIYTQGEWHYFVTVTYFYGHYSLLRMIILEGELKFNNEFFRTPFALYEAYATIDLRKTKNNYCV